MPACCSLQTFLPLAIGAAAWIALAVVWHPFPFDLRWAHLLLLLGPLVIVPLGLRVMAKHAGEERSAGPVWTRQADGYLNAWQLPAALALIAAFLLPVGWPAAAAAMPWLVFVTLLATLAIAEWLAAPTFSAGAIGFTAARILILIGGAWVMADRLAIRPLDFEPVIVLLTGIHFHYAGFALPIVAALVARARPSRLHTSVVWMVILAVPAVAAGITASKLGAPPLLECLAAWWMALAGVGVAIGMCDVARRKAASHAGFSALWGIAATVLIATMVLAAMYGTRAFAHLDWLSIPQMRAWHGTGNALGFAVCGLWGGWVLSPRLDSD